MTTALCHCDWISALDSQLDIRILRSQQILCHSPRRFHRSSDGGSQVRSKDAYFQLCISSIQHVIRECIVAGCVNSPGVGRVFAPISRKWYATDSRYFSFGCIRVSSAIGIRSRWRCSYGFSNSHPSRPFEFNLMMNCSRPLGVAAP